MIYLTYNDSPSGVYYSQVTDVCNFFQNTLQEKITLVAFISFRNFSDNRKKIKSQCANSIVLPMFPKQRNWKLNGLTLFFLFLTLGSRAHAVIARGPFAASLALKLKRRGLVKKVCFDARGAYAAELNEYNVVEDEGIKNSIEALEKEVLLAADFRLAVSEALVEYWKEKFGYASSAHIVIPCTLNSDIHIELRSEQAIAETRMELGIAPDEILLVYSGSLAGWQSFHVMDAFLQDLFAKQANVKALFLSPSLPAEFKTTQLFPKRIMQRWVAPGEVEALLSACDYGLILREYSVTNKVASPTKFAEYLLSGLPVIISQNIGDFSSFIIEHNCGHVVKEQGNVLVLQRNSYTNRQQMNALAKDCFVKSKYRMEYERLVKGIN
jgi:hypothetical protein